MLAGGRRGSFGKGYLDLGNPSVHRCATKMKRWCELNGAHTSRNSLTTELCPQLVFQLLNNALADLGDFLIG